MALESPALNDAALNAVALAGIPYIQPGDDLVTLILAALAQHHITLRDQDVLVVTSKIVSKAEGRQVLLADVAPGARAVQLAEQTGKDARLVELILRESRSISRQARSVLVTEHRLGFVSANSGIDQSNIQQDTEKVLLLPLDPDATAQAMVDCLYAETGARVGVIISDSHGRPFRLGTVGVAIGVAGMPALLDLRGREDLYGRELKISMQGYADMIASTAQLLSGEASEGRPVVHLRGLRYPDDVNGRATDLQRAPELDMYR